MLHDNYNAWEVVCGCVGQRISSLHRVYSVLNGEVQEENLLPLQVNFENGQILLLDGGTDGEALVAKSTDWQDPFGGSMDQETLSYVEEYGRWTLIDVSAREYYSDIVRHSIQAAYPIKTSYNKLTGVQFVISDRQLNFIFVWDKCQVLWGNSVSEFALRRVTVDYEHGCLAENNQGQGK